MINANRNLGAYESMGVPVWPDAIPDYPGPLAGLLAGLEHCETPYMVTVPCDTPNFPLDLVARLAAALWPSGRRDRDGGDARRTASVQVQPVFCLMQGRHCWKAWSRFMQAGQRKIDRWTAQHRCVEVLFDDAERSSTRTRSTNCSGCSDERRCVRSMRFLRFV